MDISGTMDGAGGVGGLLGVFLHSNSAFHFPFYDGNGNVVGLVNGNNGNVSANYEYDTFGKVIRQTGGLATLNRFRFSTKYTDDETDLVYYGYRFYNPSTGRWLSRDPIEEQGGLNLYGFVGNDAANAVDTDGRLVRLISRTTIDHLVGPGMRPVGPGVTPPLVGNLDPTLNPTPGSNTNPLPLPEPPSQNAPPAKVEQSCEKWLCRLGQDWEPREKLAADAARGQANPRYGHGVSVLLFNKVIPNASCVPKDVLESSHQVIKTGDKKNHYTVILPRPVTEDVAIRFNRALWRNPPPPPRPPSVWTPPPMS